MQPDIPEGGDRRSEGARGSSEPEACRSKSFDETEDEAKMLTRQTVKHKDVDREGDRTTTQALSFEEECGCQTAQLPPTDVTTCATPHANRKHADKRWRFDVPIILLGCVSVNTHSTPVVPFREKAVGSPQHQDHRAPQMQQPMSPTLYTRSNTRAFEN